VSRSIPPAAFLAGAAIGAVMALVALLWPQTPRMLTASDAAARVNGYTIPADDVDLALAAMARDSRNPLPADAPTRALTQLVDEELLFQRGVELNLPRDESGIRKAIVLAMIDLIVADAGSEPTQTQLRNLFERDTAFFTAEPRLRVDWVSASNRDATPQRPAAAPPDLLLGASDLRTYLGDALTRRALETPVGQTAGPFEVAGRAHWITVAERIDPMPPRFADNRDRVAALWRERAQEAALETYLDDLRARATIELQNTPERQNTSAP